MNELDKCNPITNVTVGRGFSQSSIDVGDEEEDDEKVMKNNHQTKEILDRMWTMQACLLVSLMSGK